MRFEKVDYIDKENVQAALDYTVLALNESRNNNPKYNHIQELILINRKGCTNMVGQPIQDGLFVRPVWSDNPTRDDGYYDIPVDGCNCMGVLVSVWKFLDKKL